MTPSQIRALRIIRDDKAPMRPARFARKMWPDSDGWRRSCKCGYGSSRGGGMRLAAGGFLGKLHKRGWLTQVFRELTGWQGYVLTDLAESALAEFDARAGQE